jgi:CheY-like chemotaxis protein
MKVLVADDDAAVRKSLSKVLKDAGYEVILAKNGQEAVAEFNPRQIDLMILDLNLPIQDGWEAFERITSDAPALPIIITTGEAHRYDIAMAAGVGALMEKPLDAPQLLQTIRELLAEPKEARLRRLCNFESDTPSAPSPSGSWLRQLRAHHPVSHRHRLTLHTSTR